MEPASIVIVHAHSLYRAGLRANLEATEDLRCAGEASYGQQAIQLVETASPDLLVIDTELRGVNGLEVARAIKRTHSHVGAVLLGSEMTSEQIVKVIRAGVAAYLPTTSSWDVLLDHLRAVRRGHYPVNDMVLNTPDVATQVLAAFRQHSAESITDSIYSPLSPRELQVLDLIAMGHANREIAQQLMISNQTVKNHVSSILRKLAVNDRMEAVVYALRRGWISDATGNEGGLAS